MAENTIIHEISLAGYKATSTGGMLDLGTWGSYGIEKLHLTLDAAWQDLTITAFFNVNGKVVAKRVVGKDGYAYDCCDCRIEGHSHHLRTIQRADQHPDPA